MQNTSWDGLQTWVQQHAILIPVPFLSGVKWGSRTVIGWAFGKAGRSGTMKRQVSDTRTVDQLQDFSKKMPPRNLNIIIITAFVSFLCYFAHQRARTAMIVGNALDMIDAYYVDPIEKDELLISAMDGMTSTLDQHSEYIPQQEYESFQDTLNQNFGD